MSVRSDPMLIPVLGLQIRFFYPELDHPAFGVMRAIAKDGTDTETGSFAVVFLDSDNMVILFHITSDLWSFNSEHQTIKVSLSGMLAS